MLAMSIVLTGITLLLLAGLFLYYIIRPSSAERARIISEFRKPKFYLEAGFWFLLGCLGIYTAGVPSNNYSRFIPYMVFFIGMSAMVAAFRKVAE